MQSDPIGLRGGVNTYGYGGYNPLFNFDYEGMAYFASRPLSGKEWLWTSGSCVPEGSLDDRWNTEISHEHLFFEDGQSPSNRGFGPDGLFVETDPELLAMYRCRRGVFDDCVMRIAVELTPPRSAYSVLGSISKSKYNCQDWAEDVRNTYMRIFNNPEDQEKCFPCGG